MLLFVVHKLFHIGTFKQFDIPLVSRFLFFKHLLLQVQPEHSAASGAGGRHPETVSVPGWTTPAGRPPRGGAGQWAAGSAGDAQSPNISDGDVGEILQQNTEAAGGERVFPNGSHQQPLLFVAFLSLNQYSVVFWCHDDATFYVFRLRKRNNKTSFWKNSLKRPCKRFVVWKWTFHLLFYTQIQANKHSIYSFYIFKFSCLPPPYSKRKW